MKVKHQALQSKPGLRRKDLINFIMNNQKWLNANSMGEMIHYQRGCLEKMDRSELDSICQNILSKKEEAYEKLKEHYE